MAKISVQQFASDIRNKYNAYHDVDDLELAEKVIAKYPQYQWQVDIPTSFDKSAKQYKDSTSVMKQLQSNWPNKAYEATRMKVPEWNKEKRDLPWLWNQKDLNWKSKNYFWKSLLWMAGNAAQNTVEAWVHLWNIFTWLATDPRETIKTGIDQAKAIPGAIKEWVENYVPQFEWMSTQESLQKVINDSLNVWYKNPVDVAFAWQWIKQAGRTLWKWAKITKQIYDNKPYTTPSGQFKTPRNVIKDWLKDAFYDPNAVKKTQAWVSEFTGKPPQQTQFNTKTWTQPKQSTTTPDPRSWMSWKFNTAKDYVAQKWWQVTDYVAQKMTGTKSSMDKLFKAINPKVNSMKWSKAKGMMNFKSSIERVTTEMLSMGIIPKKVKVEWKPWYISAGRSFLDWAWQVLAKFWDEYKTKMWDWIKWDMNFIADDLLEFIEEQKKGWVVSDDPGIKTLLKQVERFREMWLIDVQDMNRSKQILNKRSFDKSNSTDISQVVQEWFKRASIAIGDLIDTRISKIKWSWEIRLIKERMWDAIKVIKELEHSLIVYERWRWNGGFGTEIWRVWWIWDIAGWIAGWRWSQIARWVGKVVVGESLWKARDMDWLIQQAFEELSEKTFWKQWPTDVHIAKSKKWANKVDDREARKTKAQVKADYEKIMRNKKTWLPSPETTVASGSPINPVVVDPKTWPQVKNPNQIWLSKKSKDIKETSAPGAIKQPTSTNSRKHLQVAKKKTPEQVSRENFEVALKSNDYYLVNTKNMWVKIVKWDVTEHKWIAMWDSYFDRRFHKVKTDQHPNGVHISELGRVLREKPPKNNDNGGNTWPKDGIEPKNDWGGQSVASDRDIKRSNIIDKDIVNDFDNMVENSVSKPQTKLDEMQLWQTKKREINDASEILWVDVNSLPIEWINLFVDYLNARFDKKPQLMEELMNKYWKKNVDPEITKINSNMTPWLKEELTKMQEFVSGDKAPIKVYDNVPDFIKDYEGKILLDWWNPKEYKVIWPYKDNNVLLSNVEESKNTTFPTNTIYSLDEVNAMIQKQDKHKETLRKMKDEKEIRQQKEKAIADKESKYKEELSGHTKDMTPMQKWRVESTLATKLRYNWEVLTKKEYIEKRIEQWYTTKVYSEDKIKPMSRRAFFRADQRTQDAHEQRVIEWGKKNVYSIHKDNMSSNITKIEYDYAEHLLSNKPNDWTNKQVPIAWKANESKTEIKREIPGNDWTKERSTWDLVWGYWKKEEIELLSRTKKWAVAKETKEILEKKNYSIHHKSYTPEEIITLRNFAGLWWQWGEGTLTQFFTPPKVIEKMYDLLEDSLWPIKWMKGLEPSAGNGRMINLWASRGANFDWYELDKVPGTIAKILNPEASIKIQDFQDNFMLGRKPKPYTWPKYKFAISNPPYGQRQSQALIFERNSWNIWWVMNRREDYFTYRSLEMLEEWWILLSIVPSWFLRKWGWKSKDAIASIGTLVDAYRLPNSIFPDTPVATDILIFKKMKSWPWDARNLSDNRFMEKYPEKILWEVGELDWRGNPIIIWDISNLDAIKTSKPVVNDIKATNKKFDKNDKFSTGLWVKDKKLPDWFEIQKKHYDVLWEENIMALLVTDENWILIWKLDYWMIWDEINIKMIEVSEKYRRKWIATVMVDKLKEFYEWSKFELWMITWDWKKFFDKYDFYKEKKEPVKKQWWLFGGENKTQSKWLFNNKTETPKEKKKPIISKNKKIVDPNTIETKTIAPEWMTVDSKVMEYQTNTNVLWFLEDFVSPEKDIKNLNLYQDKAMTNYHYFQWNIYEKLDELAGASNKMSKELYDKQKQWLLDILPEEKTAFDISFSPLDNELMKRWTGVMVEKQQYNNETRRRDFVNIEKTIQEDFLDYVKNYAPRNSTGRYEMSNYINGWRIKKEHKNRIIEDTEYFFNKYMREHLDSEVQWNIVSKYNKTYNSYVKADNKNQPIVIEDVSKTFRGRPFSLRDAQIEWVNHLVNKGAWLLAYGVWVGKTITWLTAVILSMQKWHTKRPLFIVPKATLNDTWISTIKDLYPTYNVVNLWGLKKSDIKRLTAKHWPDPKNWIKDNDIAIVTDSWFSRQITFKEETEWELTSALNDVMVSRKEKTVTKAQQEADKIQSEMAKWLVTKWDTEIFIEDLWVDHLLIDEAHNYKNIFGKAEIEEWAWVNPYGAVQWSMSNRWKKMYLATQYVMNRNNDRNVYLLTATPFNNQAIEVYNILSLMWKKRMETLWIKNINDFYNLYAKFKEEFVVKWDNKTVRTEMKMKEFDNVQELQRLVTEFIDYKSWEDANVIRPDKLTKYPTFSMSEIQKENQLNILKHMESKEDGAIIVAMWQSRLNAVSPYLTKFYTWPEPTAKQFVDNSPKLKYTTEIIKKTMNKWDGTFVYMPLWVWHHWLFKQYMLENMWLKDKEVGIISWTMTQEKKDNIAKWFRNGDVKVLIWGSTTKEWIDLQDNWAVTVNLSLGWNPTEMIQVWGRVWRQWNPRDKVFEIYPLLENSWDITMYQKFEEKSSRINSIFSYQWDVFKLDDIDPKEQKLALLTDPKAKAELAIMIDKKTLDAELNTIDTDIEFFEKTYTEIKQLTEREKEIWYAIKDYSWNTYYTEWNWKWTLDSLKKKLVSTRNKLKNRQEKIERRGIVSYDNKMSELNIERQKITTEIAKLEASKDDKIKQYSDELEQYEKNRKSMEQYVEEYGNDLDTVQQ